MTNLRWAESLAFLRTMSANEILQAFMEGEKS